MSLERPEPRKPLVCHQCGNTGSPADFLAHGLVCSDECRAAHDHEHDLAEQALLDAGFTQHSEIPNLWLKDGVAVSHEAVKHDGIETVLAKHQAVVQENAGR